MRTAAAVVAVVAVTFLGAQNARTAAAFLAHSPPPTAPVPGPADGPSARTGPAPPTPESGLSTAAALAPSPTAEAGPSQVARRWVAAMWTRAPGDNPFVWLARVADITTPGLAAHLRTALPTLQDAQVVSASVEIDGAYPDALDPDTVTVTCVAHLITTTGPLAEPCATTITLTPGPDGSLLVAAVA